MHSSAVALPKPLEQFIPLASTLCYAMSATTWAKIFPVDFFFVAPVHGNFIEPLLVFVAGERIKDLFFPVTFSFAIV